jgi:glyoxylase-like metal-dependent hydrolase (beta-lactamase superfamily II)
MKDIEDKLTDFADGITAIDTDYVRPGQDASHLVIDGDRAAFVDTGTTHSVPNLLAALDARGVRREQVDWVLTTHVHLDHAGGAGELMRHLPNARCVVHPRGARHLSDPTKLVGGSIPVFGGKRRFTRLFGEVVPIPEERMLVPKDGERIMLGKRELELVFTTGHALHHYCIIDPAHRRIFSGDNFGISLRGLDVAGREFIFPTTTPVHFDPDAMVASIDKLLSYDPVAIYLTHYGEVRDVARLGAELKQRVLAFANMAKKLVSVPERTAALEAGMYELLARWLNQHGYRGDEVLWRELCRGDVELNVQGLEVWLDRITATASPA